MRRLAPNLKRKDATHRQAGERESIRRIAQNSGCHGAKVVISCRVGMDYLERQRFGLVRPLARIAHQAGQQQHGVDCHRETGLIVFGAKPGRAATNALAGKYAFLG